MKMDRLEGVGIFEGQTDAVEEAVYETGRVILDQGEPVTHVRVLLEGIVLVSRDLPDGSRVTLCTLGPGALFGARPLLDGSAHGARCEAQSRVSCAEIPADAFQALMDGSSPSSVRFQLGVVRALFRDLRAANQRVAELAGAGDGEVELVALDEVFDKLEG
jgi:CRP-like cAMP-binding protein